MPWCDPCQKSWTPTSLNTDGTCPQCGEVVEVADGVEPSVSEESHKVPWHFWLVVIAISIYLLFRLFQLVLWIF